MKYRLKPTAPLPTSQRHLKEDPLLLIAHKPEDPSNVYYIWRSGSAEERGSVVLANMRHLTEVPDPEDVYVGMRVTLRQIVSHDPTDQEWRVTETAYNPDFLGEMEVYVEKTSTGKKNVVQCYDLNILPPETPDIQERPVPNWEEPENSLPVLHEQLKQAYDIWLQIYMQYQNLTHEERKLTQILAAHIGHLIVKVRESEPSMPKQVS
jgi:hypothetical protein